MPKSRPRRVSGHGEIVPPLSKLDRIGELLKVQVETFPPKELSPEEIARWEGDLRDYQLQAIEWAFDNWRKNGNFFPVPSDIISQCDAWLPAQQVARGCSAECKARHGKGYGENDVLALLNRFMKKRAEVARELNENEIDALYAEVDKVRGQAPEWRA